MIHNSHLGDIDEFVEEHKRLVFFVCNRYKWFLNMNTGMVEYADLYSVGMMGLMKGYEKFDPTFEVKPSTYLVPMIKGEIQRFIRDHNSGPRFSRGVKELKGKIAAAGLLDEPAEKIAEMLSVNIEHVELALAYDHHSRCRSIDEVVFENEGDPIRLIDQMVAENEDPTDAMILDQFLGTLPYKHRRVFARHSIGDTQVNIAEELGVSQVQISRILSDVFRRATEYGKQSFSTYAG